MHPEHGDPILADGPLTVSPNHTVSIIYVERILQGARDQGRDVDALLHRAGIPPSLLGSPLSRVSQAQFANLIRTLRRTMRDEFMGLTSHPVKPGTFDQCCRLLVRCKTLEEALKAGLRSYRLLIEDFAPKLELRDGCAKIYLVPLRADVRAQNIAQRTFIFFAYGLACWLAARRIPLLGVDYTERRETLSADVSRIFQASIRYEQRCFGFSFQSRWLELPVVQNSQSVNEFLAQAPMNLLVRYRDQSSVSERIRRILLYHLSGEMPSLEQVGKTLAMTPQTLRRRLREEGQGYQSMKDNLRRDAAIAYLARPDLTLGGIAIKLGFSDPSTFHRAFKKWTGVAPGEYRQSRQAEQERQPG